MGTQGRQSAARVQGAWRAVALAMLLAGCAERTAQAPPPQAAGALPEFVYDGQDHSWSGGPEEGGLSAAALPAGDVALSERPWTAARNGWGPIERNRSNGEKLAGDGRALSVGGQSFDQGFGVHAGSSMTFSLGGQCRTFTASVGVDEEVGSRGSVVFQVFADGVQVHDSGVMRGADGAHTLSVDVSGKAELRLVVTDAGDGITYDHADWGAPTLLGCSGETVPGAVRISAGGPPQTVDGVSWLGCQSVAACQGYVIGGFAYGEDDAISGPVAPANEAIYQREWTGGQTTGVPAGETAFAFAVPVPDGDYQVRLHFAELNKSAPGQRVFDVNLEGGAAELTGFDVFAEAGGAGRAIVRSFPVTVADGTLNIDFVRQVENAKVSAIEILPLAAAPAVGQDISVAPAELVFSGVVNSVGPVQNVAVRNAGTGPLRVSGVSLTGQHAAAFRVTSPGAFTLSPGQSVNVALSFAPTSVGPLSAALRIESDDPDEPARTVELRGLSARGEQGNQEPPLAQIVQTLGYKINVGSNNLILGTQPTPIGDEVLAPLFVKAGPGPVTLRPVARYSPDDLLPFGYYTPGGAGPVLNEVAVIARGGEQSLYPRTVAGGQDAFDPGNAAFGLYVGKTSYAPRNNYTQDALNTGGGVKHAARIYPLKDRAGQPLPNQYLVGFEPAVNGDYQDYVFVVSNVKPAPDTAALTWPTRASAPLAVSEAQGLAVNGRLYVFGGFTSGLRATERSHAYEAASDRWTAVADMPEAVTHAAVAADGTTVYVAGGFTGDHPGPQTDRVWKYDTLSDTWSAGPRLPGARGGGALVRLGRNLHFFGGVERDLKDTGTYRRDSADHWVLNLDERDDDDDDGAWKSAAPLPNPRNHLSGVALGGKLYAIGGQHLGDEERGNQSAVHMYDPATNRWTARADLPLPLGHTNASTVVWDSRIVVVAGVTQASREVASVYEYDAARNAWAALTPLPEARQSPVADVIGGRLIVTTGSLPDGHKTTTWSGGR